MELTDDGPGDLDADELGGGREVWSGAGALGTLLGSEHSRPWDYTTEGAQPHKWCQASLSGGKYARR